MLCYCLLPNCSPRMTGDISSVCSQMAYLYTVEPSIWVKPTIYRLTVRITWLRTVVQDMYSGPQGIRKDKVKTWRKGKTTPGMTAVENTVCGFFTAWEDESPLCGTFFQEDLATKSTAMTLSVAVLWHILYTVHSVYTIFKWIEPTISFWSVTYCTI